MACLELIVAMTLEPNSLHLTSTSKGASRSSNHISLINDHALAHGLPSNNKLETPWPVPTPIVERYHARRQLRPWSIETPDSTPTRTSAPSASISSTTASITQTTDTQSCSQPHVPPMVTEFPRPHMKPRLLTDFEYDTMWDPNMTTLRLGVLLNLNVGPQDREAVMVRKALSVIRMAVNNVNERQLIPGLNMSIIVRDSQDPSLYSVTGGSAAITGAGQLISAKVWSPFSPYATNLMTCQCFGELTLTISPCVHNAK
jgi:hypothetical protein